MLGRRQKLNLQFLQIVDAFLLVIAFWGAHWLRFHGPEFGLTDVPIQPFIEFQWLLAIIPFGPIFLHAQGFYEHPERKTVGRSLIQLGRAAIVLGLIIALCAYFFKLSVDEPRRHAPLRRPGRGMLLLARERVTISRYRAASEAGGFANA